MSVSYAIVLTKNIYTMGSLAYQMNMLHV